MNETPGILAERARVHALRLLGKNKMDETADLLYRVSSELAIQVAANLKMEKAIHDHSKG